MISYIIHLLPLSKGDMTICSPEAGNIANGLPEGNITFEGKQIVMSPSLKGNNVLLYRTIFETI